MSNLQLPKVYPIGRDSFVTVPYDAWKQLCETVNTMSEVINTQSEKIIELENALNNTNNDVSKIAQILEEIYETMD